MPTSTAQPDPDAPAVSVVVTTAGRTDLLDRCLAALLRQTLDARRYEIIIVDDAPSHKTRQLVAVWRASASARGPALMYLPNPGPHGPAAARNRGWRAARAAIIAFTEEDTAPAPGWLRHALMAFDVQVDVLCGRIDIPLPAPLTEHQRQLRTLARAEFSIANCFCRRRVLERLDGFDERFPFAWREDNDLHFRLLDMRANIVRSQNALVVRPLRQTPWGASLRGLKKVAFDALLYKKHPALYRQRIRATPQWDYIAIVAALLLAPLALLAGQAMLALAAAGAWLGMTALLCARRLRGTSRSLTHVADMLITSTLLPPLTLFWRLAGAIRFRVPFA
jgi:glycosyltransferase involved in cell wall biosynthesis